MSVIDFAGQELNDASRELLLCNMSAVLRLPRPSAAIVAGFRRRARDELLENYIPCTISVSVRSTF